MRCLECGNGEYKSAMLLVNGERYGEVFPVSYPGLKCHACGAELMEDREADGLTQMISDSYRAAHGLLTGEEVRTRRGALGMSQQAFAEYLGVGVASVKRWEAGAIQDRAMDELMRVKTGLEEARRNLRTLEKKIPQAS